MFVFAYLFVPEHRPSPERAAGLAGPAALGLRPERAPLRDQRGLGARLGLAGRSSWPALAGIGLLWLFVHRSLRRPDPILRLRLLRDPLLRSTNIVFALTTAVFLGSLYLTPIFLQQVMHQSPIGSGTTTFLEVIGVAVGSQTLGRLYPRFGPRIMCGIGGILA